jgi:hypothetical protein
MGRKPTLAYINSTDSKGERDKDDDFDLMVRALHGIFSSYLLFSTTY